MDLITNIVREGLKDFDLSKTQAFNDYILHHFRNQVALIVLYGSCLSESTQKKDSSPDYFLVIDDAKSFYPKLKNRLMFCFLPPMIHHFHVNGMQSKFNVVSKKQLFFHTGLQAWDAFFIGRFSKKMALVFARTEQDFCDLIDIQKRAIDSAFHLALGFFKKPFSLDDLIFKALAISYIGDVRVESPDKIQKLYESQKTFYHHIYLEKLKALVNQGDISVEDQLYVHHKYKSHTMFIISSKIRAVLRWPKAMLTASHWLEYIIAKIERTQNIKIALNPKQKKLWFIYCWKYFIYLLKNKMIR